jgi:hypothetical protein
LVVAHSSPGAGMGGSRAIANPQVQPYLNGLYTVM